LKCCLNYELSSYLDAQKDFPNRNTVLETVDGDAYHQKTDIYRNLFWYGFERENASNLVPVPVDRVKEIILLNKEGKKVKTLIDPGSFQEEKLDFQDDVGKDSLTRFDDNRSRSKKKRKKRYKKKSQDRS
jgi:hypothetical protein